MARGGGVKRGRGGEEAGGGGETAALGGIRLLHKGRTRVGGGINLK